jgi:hypothetical protein
LTCRRQRKYDLLSPPLILTCWLNHGK